jgi:hypothetical protein
MKKFLFLTLIFAAVTSTTIHAQSSGQAAMAQPVKESVNPQSVSSAGTHAQGGDQAAMLQQLKEKVKPQMVEKTGLTDAQADRVIEINFEIRQAARGLRDLNEADRSAKIAELKAAKEKKLSEIPLTAEQMKSVNAFYEEMGKSMQQKSGN